MAPYASTRSSALSFRLRVLARRHNDPVPADELLALAATSTDCGVIRVPKGHPALCDAEALFDRTLNFMTVRSDVSQEEQHFLLAHEFGHAELHSDLDLGCYSTLADGLSADGTATHGTARVDAYGARERAELQANVFAKEFLLPRELARSLYLGGKSAEAIASSLKLPVDLVYTQIFDGVLLPYGEAATKPQAQLVPTEEQLGAAKSKSKVSLVVAGPGAGKTTSLMLRAQHLLNSGVKPQELLVLTFSNKAARDLVDRLADLGTKNADGMWVGTFHAFGLEFLRKYHDLFGLGPHFTVLDKFAQMTAVESIANEVKLRTFSSMLDPFIWVESAVAAITRAKDELAGPADYRRAVETERETVPPELTAKRLDVATIFQAYQDHLSGRDQVDFGDLVMVPTLATEADASRYEALLGRFTHVLVDEYQDVNRASARFIKALEARGKTIWAVGDPRQAIYRFRGASMQSILKFDRDFPKYKRFVLVDNRRSSPEIVKFFRAVAASNPITSVSSLPETRVIRGRTGEKPRRIRCEGDATLSYAVAAEIRRAKDAGMPYRNQAVLAYVNDTASKVAGDLNALGVPALHLGNIFEREEIRNVLSLLQLLTDASESSLIRVSQIPEFKLAAADLQICLRSPRESGSKFDVWAREIATKLTPDGRRSMEALAAIFAGLTHNDHPWYVVAGILLEKTAILRRLADEPGIVGTTRRLAMWQFIQFCRTPDGVSRYQTLGRFIENVRQRVRMRDDRELRTIPPEAEVLDAVIVMTVHGSKGLEFDGVHLVDVSPRSFEWGSSTDDLVPQSMITRTTIDDKTESIIESHNRLYVALSRAKILLCLYEKSGGYFKPVKAVEASASLCENFDAAVVPPRDVDADTRTSLRVSHQGKGIEAEGIRKYMKCPRRYLYSHVIALGSRLLLPRFMRIEKAVVDTLGRLGDPERKYPDPKQMLRESLNRWGFDDDEVDGDVGAYSRNLLEPGIKLSNGVRFAPNDPLVVKIGSADVVFRPHQTVVSNGATVRRLYRTRRMGEKSLERQMLNAVAFASANDNKGKSSLIEVVNLEAGSTESFAGGTQKAFLEAAGAVAGIQAGKFETRRTDFNCTRCVHYFYCPAGPLT